MKSYVLTTIAASILSCSLLLAEDTVTPQQEAQPVTPPCAKMVCCKMKNCKAIEGRSERIVAKLKAKAEEYTKLAEQCTNCANAQQKVADAAKALAGCDCMGKCANKDAVIPADIKKKCEELCGKLMTAREEAAKAYKAFAECKKANRKAYKCLKQGTTPLAPEPVE